MVAPVTGPHTTTTSSFTRYSRKEVWRQAKPISQPLPYKHELAFGSRDSGSTYTMGSAATDFNPELSTVASNKAYAVLKSKLGDNASLGVALAELSTTATMIATRGLQLAAFAYHLRRLDFSAASKVLRVATIPKGVGVHRSFASNWLEYSFGWRPLILDIHSAVDVLQSPIPAPKVQGTGGDTYSYHTSYNNSWPGGYWAQGYHTANFTVVCKQGCELEVTNPNLYLANKLGLVNPLVVGYELIPFSFVLNWFVNVEEFLSQGTDFYGLAVIRPWWLRHAIGGVSKQDINNFGTGGTTTATVVRMLRGTGLINPVLSVRPFQVPSWRRAANAISLVLQRMR